MTAGLDPLATTYSPCEPMPAEADSRPAPTARDEQLARARGELRLGFRDYPGRGTQLAELAQKSPCRALLPRETPDDLIAVLLNTAGGVCGDDRLDVRVELGRDAAATVTSQAAEKVYRALASPARLHTRLVLREGARLHWAPQETILFDHSRLVRRTEIRIAPGARLLAAETLVFGRRAAGESIHSLDLRDDWRVECGDSLLWADALRLAGDPPAALSSSAGLAEAEALSTVVYAGESAEAVRDLAREVLAGAPLGSGATLLDPVMVARLLGTSSQVRGVLAKLLPALRAGALDFPARLPRVWSC